MPPRAACRDLRRSKPAQARLRARMPIGCRFRRPPVGVALATPFRGVGCRRAVAREVARSRQAPLPLGADLLGAAGRSYALYRPGNGRGRGHRAAASGMQPHRVLARRTRSCRGARRALHEPPAHANPQPGARPQPAGAAAAAAPSVTNATAPQPCSVNVLDGTVFGRCMQRHGTKMLPGRHRARGSGRQAHPRRARQRRGPRSCAGSPGIPAG